MNTPDPRQMRRQRSVLVGIALLFFAPLGLAFFLYYGLGWHPGGRVNHGQLVEPPQPLPELALPLAAAGDGSADATSNPQFLKGKWTFLYLGPGSCPAACQQDLYLTRQVRTALGKDRERVQRVFLADGAPADIATLRSEHPDLTTVLVTAEAAPLVALLRKAEPQEAAADRIYLIDPLGNLMMLYPAGAAPRGMLEDIKRLLGLSHVG
jgi:cytochrome oxidase Cu insertion factor (SCO1/SenC/PrrC family)